MAKFSNDLFDEIVEEMLKEKRTPMEMMAELDVDETALFESQERIAKKQQIAMQKLIDEGGEIPVAEKKVAT